MRRWCGALIGWLLVGGLAYLAGSPPAALGVDAPGNRFSAGRAAGVIGELMLDIGAHPSGSPEADQVRERIVEHLEWLGYSPEVQDTMAAGPGNTVARVRNVIARRNGTAAGPVILCVAHYDSVCAGPGVSDDMSGVATLLEVARAQIEGRRARLPIVFLFTDAEEDGLVGAAGFVQHPLMDDVGVVLNLEARGGSGPSYMFETGPGDAFWVAQYGATVTLPSATSASAEIYARMPNDTDFSIFRDEGLPGLNFAFIEDFGVYHTPLDDLAHLDLASLQHHGEQMLAVVQRLAGLERLPVPEDGESGVFFSLAGGLLVQYGRATAFWFSLLAALGAIWAAQRTASAGLLSWSRVGAGLWGLVLCVSVPCVLGLVVQAGLGLALADSDPWRTSGVPALILGAGLMFIGWAVVQPFVARRVGLIGQLHAAAIAWALSALLCAVLVPGASYLWTWPAVALAIAANGVRTDREHTARSARAVLFVLPLAALNWMPVQRALGAAFGPGVGPPQLLPWAFLGTLWLPLWAPLGKRPLTVALGLGVLLSLIGVALTVALPRCTEQQPAKLNLVYAQGVREGTAEWQARTFGAALPGALLEAAPFERVRRSREDRQKERVPEPGWSGSRLHRAAAQDLGLEGPSLEVRAAGWVGSGADRVWRVSGLLRSPSRAHRTQVFLGDQGGDVQARVGSLLLDGDGPFSFLNVPQEGIELELSFSPPPDQSPAGEGSAGAGREGRHATTLVLADHLRSLPAAGAWLSEVRPASFVPAHEGDGSLLVQRQELSLPWPEVER